MPLAIHDDNIVIIDHINDLVFSIKPSAPFSIRAAFERLEFSFSDIRISSDGLEEVVYFSGSFYPATTNRDIPPTHLR